MKDDVQILLRCYRQAFRAAYKRSNELHWRGRVTRIRPDGHYPLTKGQVRDGGLGVLSLAQLYEQMGSDLFFWPPFWKRLLLAVQATKHPNAKLEVEREDALRGLGASEAQIAADLRSLPARAYRDFSDRQRRELLELCKALGSRQGVRKRGSDDLARLRRQIEKVPPAERPEWIRQRSLERNLSVRSLTHLLKPSRRRR